MDSRDILHQAKGAAIDSNVLRETYQIRSYEVDCRNRLSILSIFSFMQEAASKHAAALGVSIHQLFAENFTWLLSRLKIKIDSYPGWNDRIQVGTWPSGTKQYNTEFQHSLTRLQDDRELARAKTVWRRVEEGERISP